MACGISTAKGVLAPGLHSLLCSVTRHISHLQNGRDNASVKDEVLPHASMVLFTNVGDT